MLEVLEVRLDQRVVGGQLQHRLICIVSGSRSGGKGTPAWAACAVNSRMIAQHSPHVAPGIQRIANLRPSGSCIAPAPSPPPPYRLTRRYRNQVTTMPDYTRLSA